LGEILKGVFYNLIPLSRYVCGFQIVDIALIYSESGLAFIFWTKSRKYNHAGRHINVILTNNCDLAKRKML
jgi:hypothetical protein